MLRLDKLLANMGVGSRKEVKNLLKKRYITVNNQIVRDGSILVDPAQDLIKAGDMSVNYQKYIYIMLHKPQGYVSATVDDKDKTVIDLLSADLQHFQPFPVGRLDKDTEGLLLLTNDGELAHQLTSPKKNVRKVYKAKVAGAVTQEDVLLFKQGIVIDGGYQAKPAELSIVATDLYSEVIITITEGKYHQVKRMFAAVGKKVVYLKRISMGDIVLDQNLKLGEYRELLDDEIKYCKHLGR